MVYASLIAGHHHASAVFRLSEVSGNLTLKNVENVTCHCGALVGYMTGALKTNETKNTVDIKKTATVNGVSASLEQAFLIGTNNGGTVDIAAGISLVD